MSENFTPGLASRKFVREIAEFSPFHISRDILYFDLNSGTFISEFMDSEELTIPINRGLMKAVVSSYALYNILKRGIPPTIMIDCAMEGSEVFYASLPFNAVAFDRNDGFYQIRYESIILGYGVADSYKAVFKIRLEDEEKRTFKITGFDLVLYDIMNINEEAIDEE